MGSLLIIASLAAAPRLKLAALGFTHVGVDAETAAFYSEHFAAKLAENPALEVTSPKDLAAVLGLERQRALIGCADAAAQCMTELGAALGVDGLVSGQLAKVGRGYQLNLKILTRDARVLYLRNSELLPGEEAILVELNEAARLGAREVIARLRPELAVATVEAPQAAAAEAPPSGLPTWVRLSPAVAGAVALAVAGGFWEASRSTFASLSDRGGWPSLSNAQFLEAKERGQGHQTVAISLTVVAAVLIAAGVVWTLLGAMQ